VPGVTSREWTTRVPSSTAPLSSPSETPRLQSASAGMIAANTGGATSGHEAEPRGHAVASRLGHSMPGWLGDAPGGWGDAPPPSKKSGRKAHHARQDGHGRATISTEIAKKVPAIKDKAYRGSWTSEEFFEARRPRP